MAVTSEKQDVQRTSNEVSKTSNSLKEADAENPMAGYLPRSDEEYNVTLKTWCVVAVGLDTSYFTGMEWLIEVSDSRAFVWY